MADSIKERIMQNWFETIQSISIANGYRNNIDFVERFHLGTMDQHYQVMVQIKQGSEDRFSDGSEVFGTEEKTLRIGTTVFVRHNWVEDKRSTDTIFNSLEQDIYKALYTDRRRGLPNVVKDTNFRSSDEIEIDEDGTQGQKSLSFDVTYVHRIGDLTS